MGCTRRLRKKGGDSRRDSGPDPAIAFGFGKEQRGGSNELSGLDAPKLFGVVFIGPTIKLGTLEKDIHWWFKAETVLTGDPRWVLGAGYHVCVTAERRRHTPFGRQERAGRDLGRERRRR